MTSLEGLGAEVRALRDELRGYTERHDHELDCLRKDVRVNTTWRTTRQGQESILRWLVGSNVAVLIGLALAVFTFVRG